MDIKQRIIWAGQYIRAHHFTFFAIAVYLFATVYYMGPSIASCDSVTYGFGDNTAGPIWRSTLPNQGLLGGVTGVTNAPYGDNLESPIAFSLVLQTLLIKGLQAIGGPVCGYNLVNAASFMVSALVMYGFIYALLRRRWIALFAGYAVAFTPYYQMKVGGHPSYGFQALFIAAIWLFYRLITYQKLRDAILLALVFTISIYFDPYFTLFITTVLGALGLAWLIVNRRIFWATYRKSKQSLPVRKQLRLIIISIGFMIIGTLPLAGIYLAQRGTIEGSVAASRGNVLMEAKACSNWPHEYFVPFVLHPVFGKVIGKDTYTKDVDFMKQGFPCGIGEDTVGISVAMLIIIAIGTTVLAWEAINKRRLRISETVSFDARVVLVGTVLVGVFAVLLALPPMRLHGIIPTPSYELLQITSTWRTLARFYMLANIAVVTIVCIYIAVIWNRFKQHRKLLIVLFIGLFLAVFVEYQAFRPFSGNKLSTFDYSKDVPGAYVWLGSQPTIQTIAEYPLEQYGRESDAMSYYLTMQVTHKKRLFNSALSYGPQEQYKDSLKNLADPQTIPTLRAMGVDVVVAHGVPPADIAAQIAAPVAFAAGQSQFNIANHSPVVKNDDVTIIDIRKVTPASHYIDLGEGFARNTTIINSVIDWNYEAINRSVLNVRAVADKRFKTNTQAAAVCFSAQMSVPTEVTTLTAMADGGRVELGPITGGLGRYKLTAKEEIVLITGNEHNLRITDLGCRDNE